MIDREFSVSRIMRKIILHVDRRYDVFWSETEEPETKPLIKNQNIHRIIQNSTETIQMLRVLAFIILIKCLIM